MAIDRPKIIDSVGQEFELPKTFNMRSDPSSRRSSLLETAFTHGAKDVSDGMFSPKEIEISGKIWAANDAAYNTAWDALSEHLLKDNIRLQYRGRQINLLRVLSISHEYPGTVSYHWGEVSVTFLAVDPFWYSVNAQERETTITSSPKNFQFDIGGKMETWPIIIITNNADNADFKIKHITDSNRELRIQDPAALNTTVITINCRTGEVTRDGNNIIPLFTGLFLRLFGGRANEFTYTGANCHIKFQYYDSYI